MRRTTVALLPIAVVTLGLSGMGVRHLSQPPQSVHVQANGSTLTVAGMAPTIPVPAVGSFAIEAEADGVLAASQETTQRPIASIAKALTALVVLDAHPLAIGDSGPTLTMTAADVALYDDAVAQDGSTVAVTEGEQFTERQLLLGLLLPSANNLAETLGVWISGNHDAFVALLNTKASALGMANTVFDDPSGFSSKTVSTAGDLLHLADAVVHNPTLAELVRTQTAAMPDGEVVHNIDTLLDSEPGWFGIKTGGAPWAGYCLLFAAERAPSLDAPPVLVTGVVLGQASMPEALTAARDAAHAALLGYTAVTADTLQEKLGAHVSSRWGASGTVVVAKDTPIRAVSVRLGSSLHLTLDASPSLLPPLGSGASVGAFDIGVGQHTVATLPLEVASTVAPPPWWWQLVHGDDF